MADQISGLGRFSSGPSGYGQSYVERIRKGGEAVSKSITDTGATITGILEKERAAKAMVKDADFTNDPAVRSIYGMQAEELKAKIGGRGDDAYDFSKESEILRFNNDVKKFNDSLAAAEEVYQGAVTGLQELEDQHNLLMKTGGDVKQAPTQKIEGVGEVYNTKITADRFEDTIIEADLLRNANVSKSLIDGEEKFVARDQGGKVVGVFDSPEQLLERMVGLAKPDLQPVPVMTGRDKVIEEKWGRLYDTEVEAESAFVNYVLNNPEVTRRRAQEKAGALGGEYPLVESEEGNSLIAKHPSSSAGFDRMTKDQYSYVQEMLQEWRDEQQEKEEKEKPKTGSGAATEKLIGRIGDLNYTKNEGEAGETSIGGTGVALGGQVLRTGEMRGGRLQQLIYNPASETYTVVVTDSKGAEADFELNPSPQSSTRTALMGALGINNEDMTKLLREIRRRGQ